MKYEVELKYKCQDPECFEEKIVEDWGVLLYIHLEVDEYFNHPCRDFKSTDEALRIRVISGLTEEEEDLEKIMALPDNLWCPEHCQNQSISLMTYKGPKIDTESKTRKEREIGIKRPNSAKKMLQALGFVRSGRVLKIRKAYAIDNILIQVDNVRGVGNFIEFEVKCREEKEIPELVKKIKDLASSKGLEESTTTSYLEMLLQKEA